MAELDFELHRLIDRARMGETEALGNLLDKHRDFLRAIAAQQLPARLTGRLDGSDIVQQTCLSVHKQIREFQGSEPAEFVAWLRQIHERNIRNAVRYQAQAQKRSISREDAREIHDVPEQKITPVQLAIGNEDASRLRTAMLHLPEDEQEAVRLRYFENLTLPQIGEQLNLTLDAVVWLMKRSMHHLKQHLKDD